MADLSLPYIFTDGTVAEAEEVNNNFSAIVDRINTDDDRIDTKAGLASTNVFTLSNDFRTSVCLVETLAEDTSSEGAASTAFVQQEIASKTGIAQMKADNVEGAVFGDGSESCTLANGMIIKSGRASPGGGWASKTITFQDPFPGGIITALCNGSSGGAVERNNNSSTHDLTVDDFKSYGSGGDISWIAIGW